MISWLLVLLSSYLFFSLASFGDKLILSGPPNPKLYVFYVGMLNFLVIFLLPFIALNSYNTTAMLWAALTALFTLLGIYSMFIALKKFEASRVMPTIGALQPILILVLTGLFWGFQTLGQVNFVSFTLLLAGGIAICAEKKLTLTIHYLWLTAFSSFMFSLSYVFSKMVFLNIAFLPGIILMSLCTFLFALSLLFDRTLRAQVFSKKPVVDKKTGLILLFAQGSGGIAGFLQSLAVSLVPVSSLAVANSLRGVQYVFLFIITLASSFFFPKILKESLSKKIIIQKIISIMLIVFGLAMLAFY